MHCVQLDSIKCPFEIVFFYAKIMLLSECRFDRQIAAVHIVVSNDSEDTHIHTMNIYKK